MSYIRVNNGNCMSTRGQSQITSDFLSENWFSPVNDGKSELGNTTANIIANCICQVLHISLALIIINMILYFPSLFTLFIFMPATADGCYWIQYNASQFTRCGPTKLRPLLSSTTNTNFFIQADLMRFRSVRISSTYIVRDLKCVQYVQYQQIM